MFFSVNEAMSDYVTRSGLITSELIEVLNIKKGVLTFVSICGFRGNKTKCFSYYPCVGYF